MSSKTTNYNLHKIDLNDSPPDITVLNQNFDTIDDELYKASQKSTILTNEDLNTVLTEGFYRANSANTCVNKPDNTITHFGLLVIKEGENDGYCTQIFSNVVNRCIYMRSRDGDVVGWSKWNKIFAEDGAVRNFTYLAQREDCYSIPIEIGCFIDMHLPNTEADFSGRIFVGDDEDLYYAKRDSIAKKILHEGNFETILGVAPATVEE